MCLSILPTANSRCFLREAPVIAFFKSSLSFQGKDNEASALFRLAEVPGAVLDGFGEVGGLDLFCAG